MSRYAADYRYLIAYEISPQGWRKRPGLGGVEEGGGGVHLIMLMFFGGGTLVICNYHFFWGGKVLIHRTFQKTRVPLLDGPQFDLKISGGGRGGGVDGPAPPLDLQL